MTHILQDLKRERWQRLEARLRKEFKESRDPTDEMDPAHFERLYLVYRAGLLRRIKYAANQRAETTYCSRITR